MRSSSQASRFQVYAGVMLAALVLVTYTSVSTSYAAGTAANGMVALTATPTPTFTPTPTPEPGPLHMVEVIPAVGQVIELDGVIEVYFDQLIDVDAVIEAFSIEPEVSGEFEPIGENGLRFVPDDQLDEEMRYTVTIDTSASSQDGSLLAEEYQFYVDTTRFLDVTQVLPEDRTRDVEVGAPITVMFNRPVVPLALDLLDSEDLPHPLTFDPPVEGSGEWINTSMYQFHPDELAGGTEYTVTLDDELTGLDGAPLGSPIAWTFITQLPRVTDFFPDDKDDHIILEKVVEVTFNQPMDRESTEAAFSLETAGGEAISGEFEWDEDQMEFTFTPDELLPIETTLEAQIDDTALTLNENATLSEAVVWSFSTVRLPAIVETAPKDGEIDANVLDRIGVEFASPMLVSSFKDAVTVEPPLEDFGLSRTQFYDPYYDLNLDNDSDARTRSLYIYGNIQPQTEYTVRIDAGVADPYGNTLGEDYVFSFTTGDYNPFVKLNTPGLFGVYHADEPQRVYVNYCNVDNLHFKLYQITPDEFARYNLLPYSSRENYSPGENALIRDWDVDVSEAYNLSELGEIYMTEGESPLEPGIYFLQLFSPVESYFERTHFLIVSDTNLTVKQTFDEVLVWATDFETGEPVAGLTAAVYDLDFDPLNDDLDAVTDEDGLLRLPIPLQDEFSDIYYVVAGGTGEPSQFAFTPTNWGLVGASQTVLDRYQSYLYTDRPLYRPGQTVEFKAIIRSEDDARYTLPDIEGVSIQITDDQGLEIYNEEITLNEFGTLTGTLELDEDAGTGIYNIHITTPGIETRLNFQVAEYRKPEFVVVATSEQEEVVNGDEITFTVQPEYFFGGGIPNAEVEWYLFRRDYRFPWDGPGHFDFSEGGSSYYQSFEYDYYGSQMYGGEWFKTGYGTTDNQGQFTITIDADLGEATSSQVLTFVANVTDLSGQTISGSTQMIVHQGEVYVGIRPERIATAGEESILEVQVVDWEQQPVAEQSVELIFYRREWVRTDQQTYYGSWVWEVKETEVFRSAVITDDNGYATREYTLEEGGYHRIVARTLDSKERLVTSDAFQWVTSSKYFSQNRTASIELVADQDSYQPGDVAEILISSPYPTPSQALVTTERGGIYDAEVITLTESNTIYQLPITDDHAPNVFVSVTVVAGIDEDNLLPATDSKVINLSVSAEQFEITVKLTPDQTPVEPGDTVTYTIEATNYLGEPVEAEFSLALVDLALLSLTDPNSPPIMTAFYSERRLGVRTGSSIPKFVDYASLQTRFDLCGLPFEGGRGGGGGDGGYYEGTTARDDFQDTAYWNAFVVTDEDGLAEITLTLPDNLTTWRMDARGVTLDTLVGETTTDIVATLPLLVRPLTPRFFIVGDRVELAAIVQNNTEEALEIDVSLQRSGVILHSRPIQTVEVPAGGQVRVEWLVRVEDVEAVDLVFAAESEDYRDATKPTLGQPPDQLLPVYRYSAPDVVGTAGQLSEGGDVTEQIVLPEAFDDSQGQLAIQLSPSLAASMTEGLDWLEHYPYECVEQTVSRFLPNVLTYRALQDLGLSDPALEANLEAQVAIAVGRLSEAQNVDGGWGWWPGGLSHSYVTAYTVFGLYHAADAGFDIPEDMLENGFIYLSGHASGSVGQRWEWNRRAFIYYVLSLEGEVSVAQLDALYDAIAPRSMYAEAYLALAYAEIDPDNDHIQTILNNLSSRALVTATGAHWEEAAHDYWNMNTGKRSTAIILSTLAQLDPDNALLPQVVRWLMVVREANGAWSTTQETVWSLIGLTDWMIATGELRGDYDYTVELNDDPLAEGSVDEDSLRENIDLTVAIADLLVEQANRLTIERSDGDGNLYYTAHLTIYQAVPDLPAQDQGITVSRRYTIPDDTCGSDEQPACPGIDTASVGDNIQVTLTIVIPNAMYYVSIEDFIPAGTDIIDATLKTGDPSAKQPELTRTDPRYGGWGWWWFTNTDIRDERIILSADYLPAGTYEYTYSIYASLPGEYNVIPTFAQEFYFPEVYGRSEGTSFTIEP